MPSTMSKTSVYRIYIIQQAIKYLDMRKGVTIQIEKVKILSIAFTDLAILFGPFEL